MKLRLLKKLAFARQDSPRATDAAQRAFEKAWSWDVSGRHSRILPRLPEWPPHARRRAGLMPRSLLRWAAWPRQGPPLSRAADRLPLDVGELTPEDYHYRFAMTIRLPDRRILINISGA